MKTKARMMAEEMEEEQTAPLAKILRQIRRTKVDEEGGMGPMRRGVQGLSNMVAPGIEAIERMTSRPRRTSEEIDEVAREMARGRGYKKGGSVSSASKRADGCAVKGKTRGRFV